MAKVKIAWNLSKMQKQLMLELYWVGVDCVDACVARYDLKIMSRPGKRTHQLRNSIACGVYENTFKVE
ncbi:MAG: hypothetical protein HUK08_05310, partial [Bacteroidaceae bacterium]|nr:hypothetical protein [Bacteroidaceae bacterium]